jgi:hypothetical protein
LYAFKTTHIGHNRFFSMTFIRHDSSFILEFFKLRSAPKREQLRHKGTL